MLAMAPLTPLFGAVLICWIFSVCVHEFAHALVAYWGGDRSVRDKGYLHFNILAYVDPVTSILIPIVFLAMGGIPLPGGAVMIDTSALRGRHWSSLVSAAGPAANFLTFLVLVVVLHPSTGLVDPYVDEQPMWVRVAGAMAVLELFSVYFNLIPIPPLDGYGILEPYLDYETQHKARRVGWWGLAFLYFAFSRLDFVSDAFYTLVRKTIYGFGLPWEVTFEQFNLALFGTT